MTLLRRLILLCLVAGASAGCDQATKGVAHRLLADRPAVELLGGSVVFVYAENPGAFLSLGAGLSDESRRWIFGIAALAGLVALAVHTVLRPSTSRTQLVAIAAVLGGGVGNIIDRFAQGTVRDFMNVGVGALRTGIFNVADMTIMAGIGVLVWDAWKHKSAQSSCDPGDAGGVSVMGKEDLDEGNDCGEAHGGDRGDPAASDPDGDDPGDPAGSRAARGLRPG